jgi:hypothetical protein
MAGPLNNSYDSPEYNITREAVMDRVAITSSSLYFGQFIARARMYVTNVVIGIRSAASLAALTAIMGHKVSANAAFSAVAGTTKAWVSATSVGSYHTVALNRTLAAGEGLGIVFTDAKGKVYVSYEYQILPA